MIWSSFITTWQSLRGHRRLAREGAWATAGQVASAVGVLIGTRLLTEFVAPSVYGTVNLMLGLAALGKSVFVGPLFQAVLRLYPDLARDNDVPRLRTTASRLVTWSTTGLILVILLVGSVSSLIADPLWLAVGLLAVVTALEIPQRLEITILSAERRQRAIAVLNILAALVRPGLVIAVVLLWAGSVDAMMLGHVIGAGIVLVGTSVALKRVRTSGSNEPDARRQPDRQLAGEMWRYGAPLAIVALLSWVTGLSDRYVIGAFLDLDAVGVYAATYGLISYPFLVAQTVIELTLRPVYFNAVAANDERNERRVYRAWLWISMGVAGAGAALITLLREPIAELLLASEYREGAALMPWIALGYALLTVAQAGEKACLAAKRTRWVLGVQIVATVTCVVAEVTMIRTWGLIGAAMAVPVYFGVQTALALVMAQRARRPKAPII